MSATRTGSFAELRDEFFATVREVKYATMVTLDRQNRPRARVLFPVWEEPEEAEGMEGAEDRPVGWLASYRTPVKAAHLAHSPHTTYSYWSPRQNAAHVDALSAWADDPADKLRAWRLYERGGPPGVGYDPARYWPGGPDDPGFHVIRIDPWRIQVVRGTDLRGRIWQRPV
ncbi:pyridoxamine 5'-phosphate oxidase family protein [Streptomyces sp. NPDC050504]|uniref:pyridoxamine 5'-phosphate oxidase family protein n=1 Tax=Streptomyces sp. NPDC050504 TaxID=3365618 RepID=UPI003798D26E